MWRRARGAPRHPVLWRWLDPNRRKTKKTTLLPPPLSPLPPSPFPQATYYGHQEAQDAQGTCSFSENYANTNGLPWSLGTSTTIAMNDVQFENGKACGMCIMYR